MTATKTLPPATGRCKWLQTTWFSSPVLRVTVETKAGPVADLPFWTLGEDYELLAALAPEDAEASGLTVVGRVEEGSGVEPAPQGWDSFVT